MKVGCISYFRLLSNTHFIWLEASTMLDNTTTNMSEKYFQLGKRQKHLEKTF